MVLGVKILKIIWGKTGILKNGKRYDTAKIALPTTWARILGERVKVSFENNKITLEKYQDKG